MAKKIDPKVAEKVMLNAGLQPLHAFSKSHDKWQCKCLKCKRIITPRYHDVKQDGSGCGYCSGTLVDPKDAEKIMLKAKLKPLEPYKNSKTSWKCKCLKCSEIVFPKYSNIKQGDGGCRKCGYASVAKKLVHSPKDLKKIMQEKRLKPLEPYINSGTKWRCRCLNCGATVNPTYSDLKQGSGGCRNCFVNSRVLPSKVLETRLKKLDLELKNKYMNSRVKLEVNCLICKSTFELRLSQLKNKSKHCSNCFVNEKIFRLFKLCKSLA